MGPKTRNPKFFLAPFFEMTKSFFILKSRVVSVMIDQTFKNKKIKIVDFNLKLIKNLKLFFYFHIQNFYFIYKIFISYTKFLF